MKFFNKNTRIRIEFSVIRKRKYTKRNLELTTTITKIKQAFSAQGVFWSSMHAQALNDLYVSELRDSAEMLADALLESVLIMSGFPNVDKLLNWLSEALCLRRDQLETQRKQVIEPFKTHIASQSMLEPVRSMDAWYQDIEAETQNKLRMQYAKCIDKHRTCWKKHWWKFMLPVPFASGLITWFNDIWDFIETLPTFISTVITFFKNLL